MPDAEPPPAAAPDESKRDPRAQLRRVADALAIARTTQHVFLCADQTKPECCDRERSLVAWEYLKRRLKELGLASPSSGLPQVYRTKANCLRMCVHGPIMVVYPEGTWYHSCDPPVIERVLQEHLLPNARGERGRAVEEYVIVQHALAIETPAAPGSAGRG